MSGAQEVRLDATALVPLVHGVLHPQVDGEALTLHRLDPLFQNQFPSDFLQLVEQQGAGGFLGFETNGTELSLEVSVARIQARGAPREESSGFVLTVDEQTFVTVTPQERTYIEIDPLTGQANVPQPRRSTIQFHGLPVGPKCVKIWFPYDEVTQLVALTANAPVVPIPQADHPWVHYGSSISHGASAAASNATWPVLASTEMGLPLVNLGLSGNALLDPFVARTIVGANPTLVTMKVGINAVNGDSFTQRTFGPALHGFLDVLRDSLPDTPIVLSSALACPLIEDVPGPTIIDPDCPDSPQFITLGKSADLDLDKLSLQRTREIVGAVFESREDPHLYFIDGLELLGHKDLEKTPLPDRIHPSPEHHALIARRFATKMRELGIDAESTESEGQRPRVR